MLIRFVPNGVFFRVLMGGVTEEYQSEFPLPSDARAARNELQGENK